MTPRRTTRRSPAQATLGQFVAVMSRLALAALALAGTLVIIGAGIGLAIRVAVAIAGG